MKHNIYSFLLLLFAVCVLSSTAFADDDAFDETKRILRDELKTVEYKERGWILDLKLKQRADSFENSAESSFRYRLFLEPDFKLKISDNFFFDAHIAVITAVGSVQNRFGDLRVNDGVALRDARLFYRTNLDEDQEGFWTQLSLGAIDQREFLRDFDIFMSGRALPGAEQHFKYQKFYYKKRSFGFDFRSFQGVPASQALNLDFAEKENTPFYWNANLQVFLKDMNPEFGYKVEFNYGLYDYSTLPSVIAQESNQFGNTTDGADASAEFLYDYKGWYGGWSAILSWQAFEFNPYVKIVTNTAAPDGQNQGQMAGALFRYHDKSLYSIDVEPFHFFNEKDASVASYNSTLLGHNNREGFGINLALHLPRRNLRFRLSYVDSGLIEDNGGLQLPSKYVGFNMEYTNEL